MFRLSDVTKAQVLVALSKVMDPEIHKDLVSLKMIKDIEINDSQVSFTIELTTPACPLRHQIQKDAENAVLALEGVEKVEVKLGARVQADDKIKDLSIKNIIAICLR